MFFYFFPNVRQENVDLQFLKQAGLGYAFDPDPASKSQQTHTARGVTNGPGGEHGSIVVRGDALPGYYPKKQTWQQESDFWIGFEERPTAAGLKRETVIPGDDIQLEDGDFWTFPKATQHFADDENGEVMYLPKLPRRFCRDRESGEWTLGGIKPRYARLWDLAIAYTDYIVQGGEFSEHELILECFATNYRVGPAEIDILGVYDQEAGDRIIRTLLDLDALELLQKKNRGQDGGTSSDGLEPSTPAKPSDSVQLSPISSHLAAENIGNRPST